jgi:NAD(P)-dependent dehydrogenase (short-subunit alcohol dehydrogenase family)
MNLINKKVVITGGNGALGSAVARKATELGAEVKLLDLQFTSPNLNENNVEQYAIDLLDLNATQNLFSDMGPIDAVFNIAGGFSMGASTYSKSDEQWDKMFALNVTTLRNVVKSAIPAMIRAKSGNFVNVGALGALYGSADMSAYIASKNVVMRLTESLSAELKDQGINVNAVLPNVIDTPANRAAMPDADPSLWVNPDDLANVICFLGSDAAKAIHGALVPVAGLC